jgi:hypothetical protein
MSEWDDMIVHIWMPDRWRNSKNDLYTYCHSQCSHKYHESWSSVSHWWGGRIILRISVRNASRRLSIPSGHISCIDMLSSLFSDSDETIFGEFTHSPRPTITWSSSDATNECSSSGGWGSFTVDGNTGGMTTAMGTSQEEIERMQDLLKTSSSHVDSE